MNNKIQQISVIILLLSFTVSGIAQQNKSVKNNFGKIGISYSLSGTNDMICFQELAGSASYNSKSFFVFGLHYVYPLNNWLNIETGLEYAKHTIVVNPNLPPDMDNSAFDADLTFIEIPVTVRADFLKFFFANLGFFTDFDISSNSPVDSQTGIGVIAGIAVKYDFKSRLSLFANPYLKVHALIPFTDNNNQQHMMESGFRFGITYEIQKN